jgi:HD superfamily phosphohydrolase YqeK
MYTAHTSNRDVELLDDRLAKDPAGELLMSMLHQLERSRAEIAGALDQPRSADEQTLLQGLQNAVQISESMLRDVWQTLHQRAAPC